MGLSFEAFVIEEMLNGLSATDVTAWHYWFYRTKNGAEIDLILDGKFGILPIEIKYGSSIHPRQLTLLKNFLKINNLPLGLIINNADTVEQVADGIVQVSATMI